jgi:hypothetical protein
MKLSLVIAPQKPRTIKIIPRIIALAIPCNPGIKPVIPSHIPANPIITEKTFKRPFNLTEKKPQSQGE